MRAIALALVAALALPALAEDLPPVPPAAPIAAPAAAPAVIESAQLDVAAVEEGASLELFGLSSAETSALIFLVVAITITVATQGDAEGVPP